MASDPRRPCLVRSARARWSLCGLASGYASACARLWARVPSARSEPTNRTEARCVGMAAQSGGIDRSLAARLRATIARAPLLLGTAGQQLSWMCCRHAVCAAAIGWRSLLHQGDGTAALREPEHRGKTARREGERRGRAQSSGAAHPWHCRMRAGKALLGQTLDTEGMRHCHTSSMHITIQTQR